MVKRTLEIFRPMLLAINSATNFFNYSFVSRKDSEPGKKYLENRKSEVQQPESSGWKIPVKVAFIFMNLKFRRTYNVDWYLESR